MTFYIPPGSGTIAHKMLMAGDPDPYIITLGWNASEGTFNLNDVATSMHNAFKTLHSTRSVSHIVAKSTVVTLETVIDGDTLTAEAVGDQAGAGSTTTLPQNCAYLLKKNTGFGGKHNKGRLYYPGVPEGGVDNAGVLDASQLSAWNTALATYVTAMRTIDAVADLVLLHNPRLGVPQPAPTPIASITCDLVIATQRRRLRK